LRVEAKVMSFRSIPFAGSFVRRLG